MRKLATIQIISKLSAIPNSDNLEVADILGWKAVVRKGEFKESQKVIYCEIDSFLPIKPEYEFLRKSCYKKFQNGEEGFRIKTIRLRGQVSQGLVLPITEDLEVGTDVTERLGIVIYNPPIPACLMGSVKAQFPNFIPKTDETRVQVLQDVLTRYKGTKCYVTEKVDGSSGTFFMKDGVFGVCSRNLELLETEGNSFWKIARELQIEEKLKQLGNYALQGEVFGFGIQDNPLKLSNVKVVFFNVFDIDKYKYLEFAEFEKFIHNLGYNTVPIIEREYILQDDIPTLVQKSIGKSIICPTVNREGIVIRPLIEMVDLQMSEGFSNGRLSFKSINPEYLLEEK